ncbi:hypothetical protein MPER_05561, partial [Moniliophthora perniciosa FA553]
MQFTGGGSLESNAQRLMEHRAKATTGGTAVDTVYKDENGVMWLDEQERVEYQALLPLPSPSSPGSWVQFAIVKTPGPGSPVFAISPTSVKSMTPTERELEGLSSLGPTMVTGLGDWWSLSEPKSLKYFLALPLLLFLARIAFGYRPLEDERLGDASCI